jgi:hypothetical protein
LTLKFTARTLDVMNMKTNNGHQSDWYFFFGVFTRPAGVRLR